MDLIADASQAEAFRTTNVAALDDLDKIHQHFQESNEEVAYSAMQALHALGPEYLLPTKEQLWSFANIELPNSTYILRTIIQASNQYVTEDVHFDNVRIAEILLNKLLAVPYDTMFSVETEALQILEKISTHSALWMSLRPNLLESISALIKSILQLQNVTPVRPLILLLTKNVVLGRYHKIEKFDAAIEAIRGTRIVDLTALVSADHDGEALMAVKCEVLPTVFEAALQEAELPKMEALQCILAFMLGNAELPLSLMRNPDYVILVEEILFSPEMQQIRDEAQLDDEKLRTLIYKNVRSTAVTTKFSQTTLRSELYSPLWTMFSNHVAQIGPNVLTEVKAKCGLGLDFVLDAPPNADQCAEFFSI